MKNERIILGLDIGVGSIGWGLVEVEEAQYCDEKVDGTVEHKYRIINGRIIDRGVRTFQIPQDRQEKSLALIRGSARRSRWTTRRKAERLKKLMRLGKEFGLIDQDFNRDDVLKPKKGDGEGNWDIWLIRKESLERRLTDVEFFRVLYHIAKHRGFYFHTKAEETAKEEGGSEEGKVKAGLAAIKRKLEDGGWKTVGQMFWEEYKQSNPDNKRKRNARDKYEKSIHRSLLRDEIEKIFEAQRSFGYPKAKEELQQRYIDEVLMYEEGIDEDKLQKMMSDCEFTGERCAPRESYTAERFSLFNRLNTLELVDTQGKDRRVSLDDKQRSAIEGLAYKNTRVTFAQIRKELGLNDDLHLRFNLCSYSEKNPEYKKKLECKVEKGRLQYEDKHIVSLVNIRTGELTYLDGEIKKVFESKKLYRNSKKIHVYYSDIRKQLDISGDFRFNSLSGYTKSTEEFGSEEKYIKQFENNTFVELKGYHKIRKAIDEHCDDGQWERLSGDGGRLDLVAEALTYCKSDETRRAYLKEGGIEDAELIGAVLTMNMKQVANFSQTAMVNLLGPMEKGMLFHEAKESCGYGRQEYDKQAILKPYSGFYEKNPVVARVISQTRKLVNALIRKYGKEYPFDQIHIEVATELANSKKRKREIWEGQERYREQKEAAKERCREFGIDPEEGQNLLKFRLAEQQNCRCPYSDKYITFYAGGAADEIYVLDCEIDHIIPMSRSFNDSLNNKVLCDQQANQNKRDRIPFEWFEEKYGKDSQEWSNYERRVKKLDRMPYGKKKNLVRKSWTEKDKEKFITRNLNDTRYAARHIADYLRKYFDFSRSKRDDIKEVSRIQLRSGGVTAFLRHMWGLNKNREENDLHHALDALVVACSTYGHVYLVSNLSKAIERKGKNWYKHFGRDKFKPWNTIREDIGEAIGEVFVSRMPRHTVTAAGHKENPKSLKEKTPGKRVVKLNGGYAEMGEMVRADVFGDDEGRNYMVPIYAVDIFSNRPLPDKYLRRNDAPYGEWPSVKDDGLTFRFSLFKDDLISIDGTMYYVSLIKGTRAKIVVKNVDRSAFENGGKEKEIGYRRMELKKYMVDVLGGYREIKQEKRVGNKFERKMNHKSR